MGAVSGVQFYVGQSEKTSLRRRPFKQSSEKSDIEIFGGSVLDFWVGFFCVLFFILNCIFLFCSALLRCSQHSCVSLRCTKCWFDTLISCNMVTTIALGQLTILFYVLCEKYIFAYVTKYIFFNVCFLIKVQLLYSFFRCIAK